jgi:dolichol-phosphate mannosyltransferase
VLRQKLFTYTSCFRVYRRSAVVDLRLRETGFLGVAETLGRLDLRGAKIIEHPATLEVRLFGQSKMKVLRTIRGHLKLLARLSAMRLSNKIDIVGAPLPVSIEPQQPVEISQKSSSTFPMES